MLKHRSIAVNITLPEPLYFKLSKIASENETSFSQAIGITCARGLGLDLNEYGSEAYRKRAKNAPKMAYGEIQLKAAEAPIPLTFDEMANQPRLPYYVYDILLTKQAPFVMKEIHKPNFPADFLTWTPEEQYEWNIANPPTYTERELNTKEWEAVRKCKEHYGIPN